MNEAKKKRVRVYEGHTRTVPSPRYALLAIALLAVVAMILMLVLSI